MEDARSDAELVRTSVAGELSAFEELIRRHQNGIYQHVLGYVRDPEEAQDLVQETFLTAFQGLSTLRETERLAGWLRSIARNACLNALRSRRRMQAASDRLKEDVLESARSGESSHELGDDNAVFVRDLLSQLPVESAQAVVMYYMDEVPVATIAKHLGCSPQAVKQRLYRARKQLQGEALSMMRDSVQKERLPEGFERRIIACLLESGREDRLHMRYDRARERLQEALDLAPDDPEVLLEFGSSYDVVGWPDEKQVEALEQAAALALPGSAEAMESLYQLTIVYGHYKPEDQEATFRKCMALCDKRLAETPREIATLKCKAQLLRIVVRDDAGAEKLWRIVTEEAPEGQEAWFFLARVLGSQERYEEAIPLYEKVRKMDPTTQWAYGAVRQLAVHYAFRVGDGRKAVSLMEEAYALKGTPVEAGNLIYFYSATGQLREAIHAFESVDCPEHHPRVLATVGIGYWKRGDLNRAREALESAIDRTTDEGLCAEVQLHLAAVLFALEQPEEAGRVLEGGLDLDLRARGSLAQKKTSAFWEPWTMWLAETLEIVVRRDPRAESLLRAVRRELVSVPV